MVKYRKGTVIKYTRHYCINYFIQIHETLDILLLILSQASFDLRTTQTNLVKQIFCSAITTPIS